MASQLDKASLRAIITLVHSNVVDPGNGGVIPAASDNQSIGANYEFATGNGALQAETAWHDTRTLASGTSEELDLNGATIQNVFGEDLDFVSIKGMVIINHDIQETLAVGGAAANGWSTWVGDPTDKVKILPGGSLLIVAPTAAGFIVTPGTGDLLRIEDITGGGNAPEYSIVLIGDR